MESPTLMPVKLEQWQSTPFTAGRPATQGDVDAGSAVFLIGGAASTAIDIKLPHCAILSDATTGKKTPVILIQAE
ncbi:MAG: hypothetical protein ABL967_20275, partial [Bryobacteraceae bacterium]